MTKNPLQRLADFGQSVWNDNLSRDLIRSGGLQRLIDEDGVVGVTSNPSIFDSAISRSSGYDDQIERLVGDGRAADEVYLALAIQDIQDACDILLPIWKQTDRADGYVSLEVSPQQANDTRATIAEVRRLHALVDRPNLMIKIPGTPAGIPAIEQMLYEGININITLLFALDAYRDVMEAYVHAIERRIAEGKPVNQIYSVASFFVSRVDTEADKRLQTIIDNEPDTERAKIAESLLGTVAIANARLAYQAFKEVFNSDRFGQLAGLGANIQRPLWASTSTKNPAYSDTLYVDELIGPNTVQTLAPASIESFRDHGTVSATVERDVDRALAAIEQLEEIGVSYQDIVETLVRDGVAAFAKSFDALLASLEEKRGRMAEGRDRRRDKAVGALSPAVDQIIERLSAISFASRLNELDASLWSDDPTVQSTISERLGWMQVVDDMLQQASSGMFDLLAREVRQRGYQRIVLLGMGGSSLAPEVMATIAGRQRGFPALEVLDTTNPDTIRRFTERAANERTLFVVSSKSGTTIETATLFSYFLERHGSADIIAITDPGSRLEVAARSAGCWKVYLNRHDIGGRYSALSYFGLIPATAAGIDVTPLLREAKTLLPIHNERHPGIWLGAVLGAAATVGRDKLTVIAADPWASFGDWLEQLVAESTGKEGRGILPVVRESLLKADSYSDDRLFALIETPKSNAESTAAALREIGFPVDVEPTSLGRLFLLWEIATAVAGHLVGINPFDEPDVQTAKDATNQVLSGEREPEIKSLDLSANLDLISQAANKGDYIAIMAYGDRTPRMTSAITALRRELVDRTGLPVTAGYGPRFLHSTGQLHKGGPPNGIFLQLVETPETVLDIPGYPFTFGELFAAQCAGDFQVLKDRGLRVFRSEVTDDDYTWIARELAKSVEVPAN